MKKDIFFREVGPLEKIIVFSDYYINGKWRLGLKSIYDNAHNNKTYFYYDNVTNYLWDDHEGILKLSSETKLGSDFFSPMHEY